MSTETKVVFLKGRKTVLRPLAKVDIPTITKWINDPEVRHFVSNCFPQTEQDEEEWLAGLGKRKQTDAVFMIETSEGQPIGLMGIHSMKWIDRTATTGALIGEKEFWGKGYGSDAKMTLLNYAFGVLNLRKICSSVIAYNERSRRYSLKCGYKEEGVLKEHIYCDGKYWDLIQLAVFQENFTPLWEEYQSQGS